MFRVRQNLIRFPTSHLFVKFSFLTPFKRNILIRSFCQYTKNAESNRLRLNELQDNEKARQKRKIVGRGHNSGRGRKSGRGMKGQKAHSSRLRPSYCGGASPLHLKIPKKGKKCTSDKLSYVTLDKIDEFIKMGKIEPRKPITMKVLEDSGACNNVTNGVKLLQGKKVLKNGKKIMPKFKNKCHFEVTAVSKGALKAVEEAGGRVQTIWFSKVALKAHLNPSKFEFLPRSDGIAPPAIRSRFKTLLPPLSIKSRLNPNQFESKNSDFDQNLGQNRKELSFEEKVEICEKNGRNEEIQRKLNEPLPTETAEGKRFRSKKNRFYHKKSSRKIQLSKEVKNDPEKLKLLEMKCKLNILD